MVAEAKDRKKSDEFSAAMNKCIPGVLLAVFFSFVTSLSMLIPPLYMLQLFDKVISSGSLSTLVGLSLVALLGITMFSVFDYLRSRVYGVLGNWLGRRLSEDLMDAALSQSLRGAGAPGQTFRDIGDVKGLIASGSMTAGLELVWSPIFFVVLFWIHPAYGTVAVIGALILMALAVLNEVLTRSASQAATESGIGTYNQIGEALRNAEAIEAMGILPNVVQRWRKSNDETVALTDRLQKRSEIISTITRAVRLILQMSVFATGAVLVVNREVSAGTLIAASMIMSRGIGPIEALINGWRQWLTATQAFRRIVDVSNKYSSTARSETPLPRPAGHLSFDRVVFVPPGMNRAVIKAIQFEIAAGELIALVGPSAAGKSTLARLMVGVWPPSSGAIYLDGHDVYAWERTSFGQYVGYLPQSVELFSGTVRDNISRLNDGPIELVIEAAKKAQIHELIGKLKNGYETDLGTNGFALTGGQRQRLGLARALYGSPSLIVLDEPDSSLDSESQIALVETLKAEKAKGRTIVVVTHRPNLLRIADRVVVMKDGMIQRITTPDNILDKNLRPERGDGSGDTQADAGEISPPLTQIGQRSAISP
jgi:ATP-binding cassette, subfamily C, bacterial